MGMLVLDMETRFDAVRNNARAVAVGRRWRAACEATRKEQSHAIGSTQIEILANHGFEEVPTLDRTIENLREADFQLAECDPMIKARGPIVGTHRPGKAVRPPIEQLLKVTGPELVTDRLQADGIGARQKPVIETGEGNLLAPQLLFHPLVAIQTDLDRVRYIRADLDEGWSPGGVLQIKVVVIDGYGLPREIERDSALRPAAFVRFERPRLLLGYPNDHHSVV